MVLSTQLRQKFNTGRNICDIPPGSTRHVPQWLLARFGIGLIHGRRDGGTHYPPKKTVCQSGFPFQRYKPLKSVTTAGRPAGRRAGLSYSGFSLILSRTRLAFGLARNNISVKIKFNENKETRDPHIICGHNSIQPAKMGKKVVAENGIQSL